jgi:hypothetical protein
MKRLGRVARQDVQFASIKSGKRTSPVSLKGIGSHGGHLGVYLRSVLYHGNTQ